MIVEDQERDNTKWVRFTINVFEDLGFDLERRLVPYKPGRRIWFFSTHESCKLTHTILIGLFLYCSFNLEYVYVLYYVKSPFVFIDVLDDKF